MIHCQREVTLGRVELLVQSGCPVNIDHLLSIPCEKGKTIAANKLLDFTLEREVQVDLKSYDKVLDALLEAGKTLNAYSLLCKMMEKGGATEWSGCQDLINSLNREGMTKQADIRSRALKGGEKKPHASNKDKKKKKVSAAA